MYQVSKRFFSGHVMSLMLMNSYLSTHPGGAQGGSDCVGLLLDDSRYD